MKELTLYDLKSFPSNTIFASGIGLIMHPWFNDCKTISEGGCLEEDHIHTKVRWVAVRGGYHNWAIYHSLDANFVKEDYLDDTKHLQISNDRIARGGAKLYKEADIRRLVPCTDGALDMYR